MKLRAKSGKSSKSERARAAPLIPISKGIQLLIPRAMSGDLPAALARISFCSSLMIDRSTTIPVSGVKSSSTSCWIMSEYCLALFIHTSRTTDPSLPPASYRAGLKESTNLLIPSQREAKTEALLKEGADSPA